MSIIELCKSQLKVAQLTSSMSAPQMVRFLCERIDHEQEMIKSDFLMNSFELLLSNLVKKGNVHFFFLIWFRI